MCDIIALANRVALLNTWTDLCTFEIEEVQAMLRHACPIFEELKR